MDFLLTNTQLNDKINLEFHKARGFVILPFIKEQKTSWEFLSETELPIYIYGMGDGAVKIMSVMEKCGIRIKGIFASDEFVRGHSFMGFKVMTLSQVEEAEDDFVVVLAFAAGYRELYDKIFSISKRHIVLAPDVPVIDFDGEVFDFEYIEKNEDKLAEVYSMLYDEKSKQVFSDIINYKISGKIEYLDNCTTEKSEVYEEIIKPSSDEIYIDLGAYRGDTVEEFLSFTGGKYQKIIALEPDGRNYKKLLLSVEGKENIICFNSAVWNGDTTLFFSAKAGRQSAVSKSGKETDARCVDSILSGEECTIIKMDVEGAEKEAIEGAEETIIKYKPKLMISLYHRNEDIFSLPLQIKSINPDYKFILRHQLYIPAWETNLYCI